MRDTQAKLVALVTAQGSNGIISSELPKRYKEAYKENLVLQSENKVFRIKDLLLSHPGISMTMHKGVQPKYIFTTVVGKDEKEKKTQSPPSEIEDFGGSNNFDSDHYDHFAGVVDGPLDVDAMAVAILKSANEEKGQIGNIGNSIDGMRMPGDGWGVGISVGNDSGSVRSPNSAPLRADLATLDNSHEASLSGSGTRRRRGPDIGDARHISNLSGDASGLNMATSSNTAPGLSDFSGLSGGLGVGGSRGSRRNRRNRRSRRSRGSRRNGRNGSGRGRGRRSWGS